MTNPYIPATPLPAPSQQFTAAFADPTTNPSTTAAADKSLWPPSINVTETPTADYVTVPITKTTDTVTSIDVVVSGAFYIFVRGENRGAAPCTWQGVWPAMWFDVYLTAAPDAGIDAYDARSDLLNAITLTQPLEGFDGYPGIFGTNDLYIPGPGTAPLVVPMIDKTITIAAGATADLVKGASGTTNLYVKARATTPAATEDNGVTWGAFGSGNVYIDSAKLRFIGNITVNVNRS